MQFDPDTLYSLDELRERLAGAIELPTLLERLGLREKRIFRDALFGWEILEASRRAGPYGEVIEAQTARTVRSLTSPAPRRGRKTQAGSQSVRRLGARDLED
jgi:hypothetical protein